MKQAIQEGFILDVIANYTPVDSYYHVAKTVEDDPEFDKKQGAEEDPPLRRIPRQGDPQEGGDHGRSLPSNRWSAQNKIGGKARAMIVSNGIAAGDRVLPGGPDYLAEIKSPYKAIVAFSGELEYRRSKKSAKRTQWLPEQGHRRPNCRRTRTGS